MGTDPVGRTFKVGPYECTLTVPSLRDGKVMVMTAEWAPEVPNQLTPAELEQYRLGRDTLLQEFANMIGGKAVVIE